MTVHHDPEHRYFDGADGPFPSVTTVLGVIEKPNLLHYTRRQAIDFTLERIPEYGGQWPTAADLEAGATRASLAKADLGDRVHAAISDIIGKRALTVTPEIDPYLRSFARFEKDWQPRWVGSEIAFVNREHGFGGTGDALALIEDTLYLLDFKTGRRTWAEHVLQLVAYSYGLSEQYPIERLAIVQIRDDGYVWKRAEDLCTPEQFAAAWPAFLAALTVYRWLDMGAKEVLVA